MSARQRTAFTLTEMLVVISIIGVLASMLLPAVQAAREAARRATCTNNMRACARAFSSYDAAKGFLPASRTFWSSATTTDVLNWPYPILPQLEQDALYTDMRTNGRPTRKAKIEALVCPSDSQNDPDFPLSYVVNGGCKNDGCNVDYQVKANGQFARLILANGALVDKGMALPAQNNPCYDAIKAARDARYSLSDIARNDGTSTTLLLAENADAEVWWRAQQEYHAHVVWWPTSTIQAPPIALNQDQGQSLDIDHARPASLHPGGFNLAFCDGSVRFMSESVNYAVFCVLMTSQGANAADPSNGNSVPWQNAQDANYPGTNF
jgi:prepilin-type N-terminal cleavage/methylation domain-containing protein/prepilin-type processing-associated H-X9-DG protein